MVCLRVIVQLCRSNVSSTQGLSFVLTTQMPAEYFSNSAHSEATLALMTFVSSETGSAFAAFTSQLP